MLLEQWTQWKPIQGVEKTYLIKSVSDISEKLEIILFIDDAFEKSSCTSYQKEMRIIFKQSIIFYKSVDEHCTIEDATDLRMRYGNEFVSHSSFFKVTDSKYLHFLKEESCEDSENKPITHFVIFDINLRIDVITTEDPFVEWIEHVS